MVGNWGCACRISTVSGWADFRDLGNCDLHTCLMEEVSCSSNWPREQAQCAHCLPQIRSCTESQGLLTWARASEAGVSCPLLAPAVNVHQLLPLWFSVTLFRANIHWRGGTAIPLVGAYHEKTITNGLKYLCAKIVMDYFHSSEKNRTQKMLTQSDSPLSLETAFSNNRGKHQWCVLWETQASKEVIQGDFTFV